MTVPIPTLPPAPRSDLPRKLALLFLLAVAAALGIVLLIRAGQPLATLSLLLLASGLLGLVSGFGARLVLKQRRFGLRLLAAVAALALGLLVLGLFTGWQYGLSVYFFHPGRLDWAGLVQLVIGVLSAALALLAWRKAGPAASSAAGETPTQPALVNGSAPDRVPQPGQFASRRSWPVKKPRPAFADLAPARTKAKTAAGPKPKPEKTARLKPAAASKKRRARKADVQLAAGEEEHCCPYCLELVQPDDARGIVECKICHSLHHADCWAITGVCQVPHLNS